MERKAKQGESQSSQDGQRKAKTVFEPADSSASVQRMLLNPTPGVIQQLQRTIGNQAVIRLLAQSSPPQPTIQRTVGGIGSLPELKANPDAWNIFLLLDPTDQGTFKNDVEDTTRDVPLATYKARAAVTGKPTIEGWFAASFAGLAGGTTPGMITTGGQDVGNYLYPRLLRFRWFGVQGPAGGRAKTRINTLGINLHRGRHYSGLGSAWCKMGPNDDSLTFDLNPQALLGGGAPGVVAQLETYAATSTDGTIRNMANNDNCV